MLVEVGLGVVELGQPSVGLDLFLVLLDELPHEGLALLLAHLLLVPRLLHVHQGLAEPVLRDRVHVQRAELERKSRKWVES